MDDQDGHWALQVHDFEFGKHQCWATPETAPWDVPDLVWLSAASWHELFIDVPAFLVKCSRSFTGKREVED